MADDNKKYPFQDDTAAQDQQKGGEASVTDEDITGLSEDLDTDVPTDTSDLGEDTSVEETPEDSTQSGQH